jgi:hypothetical protein
VQNAADGVAYLAEQPLHVDQQHWVPTTELNDEVGFRGRRSVAVVLLAGGCNNCCTKF